MPVFAPIYRELNVARLDRLSVGGASDQNLADLINAKHGPGTASAADVHAYLKLNRLAARRMLVDLSETKKMLAEMAMQALQDRS